MRRLAIPLFVAALSVLAPPSTTLAQSCADARVRVDGYCCWPGQTFDTAAGRCVGAPSCPAGWAGAGAECVPSAATSAPATASRPRASLDVGLVVGGAVMIGVGYLGAIGTAAGWGPGSDSGDYRERAPFWWLTFLPVLHPLAMIDARQSWYTDVMWIGQVLGSALEIGGIVLIVLGMIDAAPRAAPRAAGEVRVVPIAGTGMTGLRVDGAF